MELSWREKHVGNGMAHVLSLGPVPLGYVAWTLGVSSPRAQHSAFLLSQGSSGSIPWFGRIVECRPLQECKDELETKARELIQALA